MKFLLCVLFTIAGCQNPVTNDSASVVMKKFVNSMETNNYSDANKLLSDNFKREFKKIYEFDFVEFYENDLKIGEHKRYGYSIDSDLNNVYIVSNVSKSFDSEGEETKHYFEYRLKKINGQIYLDSLKYIKYQIKKNGAWVDDLEEK